MSHITYRSYKHFDENSFKYDLSYAPFHVSEIVDDIDDIYWFTENLISGVINDHAPFKRKRMPARPVSFMNSELRKEIHKKSMYSNKYFKMGRTHSLWEHYRKSRNRATKLKGKSVNEYFSKKCRKSSFRKYPKDFWNTLKPFISNRSNAQDSYFTALDDYENLINKSYEVSNSFNDFFCNVAKNVGFNDKLADYCSINSLNEVYKNHDSIKAIKMHHDSTRCFDFSNVEVECVSKLLKNMDASKAVGNDNIPPKLIKIARNEPSAPFTCIINQTFSKSCFPSALKKAEVTPLFKAKDALLRNNYRPVSILNCISKIIERTYFNELYSFFNTIFSVYIAAFRKNYGCQHVLTRLASSLVDPSLVAVFD